MNRFNINDDVKILDKNIFWNNKIATVLDDSKTDDIQNTLDFTPVKVIIKLDSGKNIIQIFPRYKLKLLPKKLAESKKITDIIKQYVYLSDIDDNKVASWIFTSKIAIAEDLPEDTIISIAKDLHYKIFIIQSKTLTKSIIAAPEITIEDIQNDYANYILGSANVKEI